MECKSDGSASSFGVHLGIMRGIMIGGGKQLLNEERLYLISKTEINSEDLPKLPMIYYQTDAL